MHSARYIFAGTLKLQTVSPCASETTQLLLKLLRHCGRLTCLLGRLHGPRITHFSAFAKLHSLPLCSQKQTKVLSQSQLEYLVGFFDGDGCVARGDARRGFSLRVGQSSNKGEALLLFQRAFGGGGINVHSQGKGLGKPVVAWILCGVAAKTAAVVLSSFQSQKRRQLMIAANSSGSAASDMMATRLLLQQLERQEPDLDDLCRTWPYLAVFFDAEGRIQVRPSSARPVLEISQHYNPVLKVIQQFLQFEVPTISSTIRSTGRTFILSSAKQHANIFVLRRLLEAGLCTKRDKALVALSSCPSSHHDVRELLASMKGNQCRHMRLDSAGVMRAKVLNRLYHSLRRRHCAGRKDNSELEREITELKAEHDVACARSRLAALRRDIRDLLKKGAWVVGKEVGI
ncbi:unnamed protein product [Polarella glacialis]|uniref:LAGLIDADG endonuclease n=1 Tax=Polarella glacialis TaxID=89957 RepID=A0A813FHF6_POLGL|nr:unnamed protein product [Polarella glacialis]